MKYWALLLTTIISVWLVAETTAAFGQDQPDNVQITGSLKLVFPMAPHGPQTNAYHVRLWSKPPCWELLLTSSNHNHRVFASPQQTYEVDVFDEPTNGPLNTAFIKVFPGNRPLADRGAEHVWLALLSQKTFVGKKIPLQDPGLGMVEPSSVTGCNAAIQDASPRQMQWNNEFPDGRSSRIEGTFKWLASTNTPAGLNIPKVSQMAMYISDAKGNRKLVSFSEFDVYGYKPLSRSPTQIPRIAGRNVVIDYRQADFSREGWSAQTAQYTTYDGKGLEEPPRNLDRDLATVPKKPHPHIYDESANGSKQVADALDLAAKEHKRVLLQFGANWCGWCLKLHKLFETNQSIAKVLKDNYVVVMIDVNKGHNKKIDSKYKHPTRFGLPAIAILDASGKQLTTLDTGKLEDGNHHSPDKVMAFLKEWAPKKLP